MPELIRITPQQSHCFFGYYDKTPWDPTGVHVLFGKTTISGRLPEWEEALQLGYANTQTNEVNLIASTLTWNFQQGCMLQWLSPEKIIFNNYDNGFVAQVVDLKGNLIHQYKLPIYALSPNKKIAMSLNFARIHQYRPGYGYQGVSFASNDEDGIIRLNLDTGESEVIITFSQLKAQSYLQAQDQQYWIDHILFSPDNRRITFLLRGITQDGGLNSRLMLINCDGTGLRCLLNTGLASHADWYDERHFAIWGRRHSAINQLQRNRLFQYLKPFAKWIRKKGVSNLVRKNLYGDAFLMIDVDSGLIKSFAENIPANEGGGHFTFDQTKRWMLNDTGIDQQGFRSLMLYDLINDKRLDIASLYTPPEIHNTAYRCDLHPRWSPSCDKICVDSVHEGERAMYLMNVNTCRGKDESFK